MVLGCLDFMSVCSSNRKNAEGIRAKERKEVTALRGSVRGRTKRAIYSTEVVQGSGGVSVVVVYRRWVSEAFWSRVLSEIDPGGLLFFCATVRWV